MEPLIVLCGVTGLAVALRRPLPVAVRVGVSAMFVMTGLAHFIGLRQELIDMVPPALPAPGLLVTISGVLELASAAGLWLPRWRLPAAAGLTLMLVALFPANVHHALTSTDLPWPEELPARTAMQVVFLAATGYLAWTERRRPRSAQPTLPARETTLV